MASYMWSWPKTNIYMWRKTSGETTTLPHLDLRLSPSGLGEINFSCLNALCIELQYGGPTRLIEAMDVSVASYRPVSFNLEAKGI